MTGSRRPAEMVAAIVIILLAGWWLWQAFQLREGPGYAAVGPRVFPIIVGLGFLGSGLALLLSSFRRRAVVPDRAAPEAGGAEIRTDAAELESDATDETDWPTLLMIAVLLAGYVALFQPLGFVITSALFLVAGAWALGSRSTIRDVVAGVALSLVTFFVFTRLLGLELPAGPLEEPLRSLRATSPLPSWERGWG